MVCCLIVSSCLCALDTLFFLSIWKKTLLGLERCYLPSGKSFICFCSTLRGVEVWDHLKPSSSPELFLRATDCEKAVCNQFILWQDPSGIPARSGGHFTNVSNLMGLKFRPFPLGFVRVPKAPFRFHSSFSVRSMPRRSKEALCVKIYP